MKDTSKINDIFDQVYKCVSEAFYKGYNQGWKDCQDSEMPPMQEEFKITDDRIALMLNEILTTKEACEDAAIHVSHPDKEVENTAKDVLRYNAEGITIALDIIEKHLKEARLDNVCIGNERTNGDVVEGK